jgi:hypothetical protein
LNCCTEISPPAPAAAALAPAGTKAGPACEEGEGSTGVGSPEKEASSHPAAWPARIRSETWGGV